MKADQVLVGHHQELKALMRRLEDTPPGAERRRVMNALATELSIHEQIEDEIFYPAVRAVSPLVAIAHAEHRHLSDQLAAVLRSDLEGPEFQREWHSLTSALEQHAGEEEREMFPQAQRLGEEQLETLGAELAGRQAQLRNSRFAQARITVKREVLRRV